MRGWHQVFWRVCACVRACVCVRARVCVWTTVLLQVQGWSSCLARDVTKQEDRLNRQVCIYHPTLNQAENDTKSDTSFTKYPHNPCDMDNIYSSSSPHSGTNPGSLQREKMAVPPCKAGGWCRATAYSSRATCTRCSVTWGWDACLSDAVVGGVN